MATPDERKVLKVIEEKGGESHEVSIANEMGLRLVYVRTILTSMGNGGYIDVFRSGKVTIGDKGWKVLGKNPEGDLESSPDEIPEERFKRYMTRGAEGESSGTSQETATKEKKETSEKQEEKTGEESSEDCRKTIEELAKEPQQTPEEKFKRYISE